VKHPKRSAGNILTPLKTEYCYVDGKKKRKYKTQLDAELNAPKRSLNQYVCEHCGFWHNGNSKLPS